MLNWLKSLLVPSVDRILADFNTITAKLERAVDFHSKASAQHSLVIANRQQAKAKAEAEVARAKSVAAKINSLIS